MVVATATPKFRELIKITTGPNKGTYKVRYNPHEGQMQVLDSKKRFPVFLAGHQVGKTVIGPVWMEREIRAKGPGDYIAGSSTHPLMNVKMLPEYQLHFETLLNFGELTTVKGTTLFRFYRDSDYKQGRNVMFTDEDYNAAGMDIQQTRIIFFSGTHPESIESATAKGGHGDEIGQTAFRRETWEAINRRLALNRGRFLITTTPYSLGWLKNEIFDPWEKANHNHPDIDIIQCDSIVNPSYPLEEYQRMKTLLPDWKFQMFCRGRFARPAGLIYDCFDPVKHVVDPFPIDKDWLVYTGHDFGTQHTACIWLAQDPKTGYFYICKEYLKGGLATHEHIEQWKEMSSGLRVVKSVGGSSEEEGSRGDSTRAGWRIDKPLEKGVEAGIQKVNSLFKAGHLFVFRDCLGIMDNLQSYSRELDDNYQPTDKIENKSTFHYADSLRYICSDFAPVGSPAGNYGPIRTLTFVLPQEFV